MAETPIVNRETVLALLKTFVGGATQGDVHVTFCIKEDLTEEQIGELMQSTSRVLSDLAKEGLVDDSGRIGKKHVYRIPDRPLPGRQTKNEVLLAEVERLKIRIKELESARDFLVDKNERLLEKLAALESPRAVQVA